MEWLAEDEVDIDEGEDMEDFEGDSGDDSEGDEDESSSGGDDSGDEEQPKAGSRKRRPGAKFELFLGQLDSRNTKIGLDTTIAIP